MPADVVIDTNVLLHAEDIRQPFKEKCMNLIISILESSVYICTDDGFDLQESKNRSKIGSEYLNHIRHGSPGYALLVNLAQGQRIKFISSKTNQNISKIIQQYVRDKTDRCFVKVAFNSDKRVLISHDCKAINQQSRNELKSKIKVRVVSAEEGKMLINGSECEESTGQSCVGFGDCGSFDGAAEMMPPVGGEPDSPKP